MTQPSSPSNTTPATDSEPSKDLWAQLLSGSPTPPEFLSRWLKAVRQMTGAKQVAMVSPSPEDEQVHLWGSDPLVDTESIPPSWLTHAGQWVGQSGCPENPCVLRGNEQAMHGDATFDGQLLLVTLSVQERPAVAVLWFATDVSLMREGQLIQLMEGALRFYEYRTATEHTLAAAKRLGKVTAIQASLQRQSRFQTTAMELCNQLATEFDLERVSLGVLSGRHVKMVAMDHTEKTSRKMRLVQHIEEAMEECHDQDTIIGYPAENASYACGQARALSEHHGHGQIVSIPLPGENASSAMVLTLEASVRSPLTQESLEVLQLFCTLAGGPLQDTYDRNRFIAIRAAQKLRHGAAWCMGAKHTWMKLLALIVMGFVLFAFMAQGEFVIELPSSIEAVSTRTISAPVAGHLKSILVEPGEFVQSGAVLARLDDSELLREHASLVADHEARITEAAIARRENKLAEMHIARARANQVKARMDQVTYRIEQMVMKAPIDGYIVSDDLQRYVGRAVETGETLFEIVGATAEAGSNTAPIAMRVILQSKEEDIHYLQPGQQAEVVLASEPGEHIAATVQRIHPTAETVLEKKVQDNTFELWAEIKTPPMWLRPGMEGEAEIVVGKKSYAWIWTRRVRNWVQMKLWEWL